MDRDIDDLLQMVHEAHLREVQADARLKRDVQVEYERRRDELKRATSRAAKRALAAGATKGRIGLELGTQNYSSIDSVLGYGEVDERTTG